MPSHPPVPPNCPSLCECANGNITIRVALHGVPDSSIQAELTDRAIIAAVARCAWLDEAAKLNGYIAEPGEDTAGYIDHLFKRADMLKNAQTWRDWGRG